MQKMVYFVILLFCCCIPEVYSRSRILQYHTTRFTAPCPGLPDVIHTAYVDGLRFARYNQETNQCEFRIPALGAIYEHKMMTNLYIYDYELSHSQKVKSLLHNYNKTSGKGAIHVYQTKSACELHEDGTISVHEKVAFDGKELMAYDKETGTFIPTTPEAHVVAQIWSENYAKGEKIYQENFCINRLTLYLPAVENDLKKKVHPNVKVSSSESDWERKLHCWVYGFYPRDVEVKWIKNGGDEIYSEEAPEILTNSDGTYQIRVSVEVTPEEGATYSCHVDHSSLENPLVVPFEFNDRNIWNIIIPVSVASLLLIVLAIFMYRKRTAKDKMKHNRVSTEDKDSNTNTKTQNLQ